MARGGGTTFVSSGGTAIYNTTQSISGFAVWVNDILPRVEAVEQVETVYKPQNAIFSPCFFRIVPDHRNR